MRLFERHESNYRNIQCTECDYQHENNIMKAQIARLKIENESLWSAVKYYEIYYHKAVKDFAEFILKAFENPFACCCYCIHVEKGENGSVCKLKAEHEDDGESCLGRYFEYNFENNGR